MPGQTAESTLANKSALKTFKTNFLTAISTALDVPSVSVVVSQVTLKSASRRLAAPQKHPSWPRRLTASRPGFTASISAGDGSTVGTTSTLDATFTLEQAKVVTASSAPMSALSVVDRIQSAAASAVAGSTLAGAQMSSVGTAGVCGNGACETGERCSGTLCGDGGCKADCPYVRQSCPTGNWPNAGECSGHGRCIGASGACDCFVEQGYGGEACDQCTRNFMLNTTTHECVRQVTKVCRQNV